MNVLRPQLRGLVSKLALFYVLLSLPSLVLVESTLLIFEFNRFMRDVDSGALVRATTNAAADLATMWPGNSADEAKGLSVWTQAWMLRLQRPDGALIRDDSYILSELTSDPIAVAVLRIDGSVLAQSPTNLDWQVELPTGSELASSAQHSQTLEGAESPYRVRRELAGVFTADGQLRGYLFIELRLPVPWYGFRPDLSLEWPIVLGYLVVFGIASSLFLAAWVTRRLNRVARAASAWSNGDFSDRIDDQARDELGRLSRLLDRMALDLKALMRSRAQFATLAERQRLARDLHDTVKQKAFALNLQLATVERKLGDHAAIEHVNVAIRLGRQIQQELVQILDEIHASDSGLPFAQRLKSRAIDWTHSTGMKLELNIDDVGPLPASIEETLLRSSDEALANIMKHSGANRATVALRRLANEIELSVVDNGEGVGEETHQGMGLANMRQRAESLPQGVFQFESSEQGTAVRFRFAIPERSLS